VGWLSDPAGVVVGGALALAACTGSTSEAVETSVGDRVVDTAVESAAESSVPEEYPDSITRHLDRLSSAPRPVDDSAMPPRHLDVDTFPTALVDRSLIVSGGPPPDGIPPIDEPRFEVASTVDWLQPDEPVLVLLLEGGARAYPIQVMIWHEIVNDTVGAVPVTVTYCPLCNSATTYKRTIRGVETTFGTSGRLFNSSLVMYDRATESLWTHFDGRGVVGVLAGEQLESIPAPLMSWGDFREAYPTEQVLDWTQTGTSRPYGTNPYTGYDDPATDPFLFLGDADGRTRAKQRVVGIEIDGVAKAYALEVVSGGEAKATNTEIDGLPIVIL